MARIPTVTRESVPQDQTQEFDEFVQQRGSIPTVGPASIMLNIPGIAKRGEDLRLYIRGDSTLSAQTQELAMLVTARELDCLFVWNAHAAAARRAGLRDELVDNLRDKKELPSLSPDETAVVDYGREYFRTRRVSQPVFDAAMARFGLRGTVQLTNLMGYYSVLAFNLNAFEVGLPEERTEPALPV